LISKGLSAGDVKNQVDNSLGGYLQDFIPYYYTDVNAYETIYKKTVNATYIDYLWFHGEGSSSDLRVLVKGGGATIADYSGVGGLNGHELHTENLTGTTGDYTIEIQAKDNSASGVTLTDICLWSVES